MSGKEQRPPPWAQLIMARRKAVTPRLSMRQAAAQAGISAQSWGNVERGSKVIGAGIEIPADGSDDMVARMAYVVGVTPAELRSCGRPGAARILEMISTEQPSARAAETIKRAIDAIATASGLNETQKQKLRQVVEQTVDRRAAQG